MTLIALACYGDHAEFVTDSMAYSRNLRRLGTATKSVVLHHLDAAILTSGDGLFSAETRSYLTQSRDLLDQNTFDTLIEAAPAWLRDAWRAVQSAVAGYKLDDSTVYLVGFSEAAGEYRAYHFASEHDFNPEPIVGLHMAPTPGDYRPSDMEADKIGRDFADLDGITEFIASWKAKPAHPVPAGLDDWFKVGLEARTRSTQNFLRILVGGSIYYTRLERGYASTMKLFDFDDTGDNLLELVGFTQHPAAQLRPCWCGSGKRHLDCHLAEFLDEPCGCGAPGRLFRDCCMIPAGEVGVAIPG